MTDPGPYADFDELISMLRAEDHVHVAKRLHSLLHEVSWTSGSELIGEVGLEIVRFQRSNQVVSHEAQELIRRCMAAVKEVWPGIEKVRSVQLGS